MALEMREKCEKCEEGLQHNSVAYICTHECTFCPDCTESMEFICPNCGGELVKRPRKNAGLKSCPINT
ncbi:DUF1272 domain-containing protein [Bacillus spongiae]|uniref:DUF1272 domain-containing protein n=1 Tax=Bacillus spongiae TaxID=2683610 RepID=A0ABU8HHS1_9BACI